MKRSFCYWKGVVLTFLAGYIFSFSNAQLSRQDSILYLFNRVHPDISSAWGPPDATSKLTAVCIHKIPDGYATLVDTGTGRALIVAYSVKEMKRPSKEMSLRMYMFEQQPPILFTLEYYGILDWAYIYDRNGDGKIDMMAYLMGNLPKIEWGTQRPKGYYKKIGEKLTRKNMHYLIDRQYGVFNYYIDVDFDGKMDVSILYEIDPDETGQNEMWWFDHYVVTELQEDHQQIKSVWWFREAKDGKWKDAPVNGNGQYFRYTINGKQIISMADFLNTDALINWANEALTASGLKTGDLPGSVN